MEHKKTNFSSAIDKDRISDTEYIRELENAIRDMHERVNTFINKMDESMHKSTVALFETYTQEVKTLRL